MGLKYIFCCDAIVLDRHGGLVYNSTYHKEKHKLITASKYLKNYIEMHTSNEIIATRWNVSRQTVHNILNEKYNISSELLETILKDTGFDFEKAFEVKNED